MRLLFERVLGRLMAWPGLNRTISRLQEASSCLKFWGFQKIVVIRDLTVNSRLYSNNSKCTSQGHEVEQKPIFLSRPLDDESDGAFSGRPPALLLLHRLHGLARQVRAPRRRARARAQALPCCPLSFSRERACLQSTRLVCDHLNTKALQQLTPS